MSIVEIKPVGEAFLENGIWHQDYQVPDEVTGEAVIKRYYHDGTDWKPLASKKIDLSKNIKDTKSGINLRKNVVNLDKTLVNLSKKSNIDFNAHRARVAVVMDYSGSMSNHYKNGSVQEVLTRLVPLGLRFDDNGELDFWLFNSYFLRLDSITLNNYENYVDTVIKNSGAHFGGTSYSPVLNDVHDYYIKKEPSNMPSFVIFITDGDNASGDKNRADDIVRKLSNYNVFIQFVGLGSDGNSFSYLKKLDDLSGRKCDNTGFISVADFKQMDDEELYKALLEQYVNWIKVMGMH